MVVAYVVSHTMNASIKLLPGTHKTRAVGLNDTYAAKEVEMSSRSPPNQKEGTAEYVS